MIGLVVRLPTGISFAKCLTSALPLALIEAKITKPATAGGTAVPQEYIDLFTIQ